MNKNSYKNLIFLLSLFFISFQLAAENIWNKNHAIDQWTENALSKSGGVTDKIIEVYSKSYRKWDLALNSAYKQLMSKLPDADKMLLRESQRKWVAYKDAEFKFLPVHVQREGGTLSRVIVYERMNNFIRTRVIELEGYNYIFDTPP